MSEPWASPVDGRKVSLGFVQTATGNRRVCPPYRRGPVERGLRLENGLLAVTDGALGRRLSPSGIIPVVETFWRRAASGGVLCAQAIDNKRLA